MRLVHSCIAFYHMITCINLHEQSLAHPVSELYAGHCIFTYIFTCICHTSKSTVPRRLAVNDQGQQNPQLGYSLWKGQIINSVYQN